MNAKEMPGDRQIAVLIDYENVGLNFIQALFDQISDVGRIIIKRAYADWSLTSKSHDRLFELGIEPIQLFRSTSGGKNSSDIRLAMDAVELLYSSPVDTFVIVSSDSDFVPLVSKLRASGKIVFGAGEQAKSLPTLVKSCDRYFYLDQVKDVDQNEDSVKTEKLPSINEKDASNLIRRAIKASTDEYGSILGTKLYQTMLRLDPSFDYRALGYSTFTKFLSRMLESATDLKLVHPAGRGDFTVEIVDSTSNTESTWTQIDSAWSKRMGNGEKSIPGPSAASDAAKIMGCNKLSESSYKTLQNLLKANDVLSSKWRRVGNTITKIG